MRKLTAKDLTLAAMVAALYAVLSYFSGIFNVAYGPIQFRFAEALTVLPFLFPAAAPGLFVGCIIANLLSPYGPLDIVFGSLATMIAAVWTMKMPNKWLAPLPPVICNGVIVSAVIAVQGANSVPAFFAQWGFNGVTIAIGELGACYVLGMILLAVLPGVGYFRPIISKKHME